MQGLSVAQMFAVAVLPLLFAITIHEVAHGWAALRLGDRTAQMLGRLTLNPIKHVDPFGTILVPGMLLILNTGFVFGWAKPVPVTWENLRQPRRDMALVAAAGPFSNLWMALFWALVLKTGLMLGPAMAWLSLPLVLMGQFGISINLVLLVLNLIPLPPLDGGRIAAALLPGPWAASYSRIEPYGFLIILTLIITNVLSAIMGPPIGLLERAIYAVFGL